jgi:hypothetical protein
VDAILTGVHRPGESHFELLEAFTDDAVLAEISETFSTHNYCPHEFGDSMLIERRASMASRCSNTEPISCQASVPAAIEPREKRKAPKAMDVVMKTSAVCVATTLRPIPR